MTICDCHVHVFDPGRYPWAPDRAYTPGAARLGELRRFHAALGVGRAVLVQPSPYGSDNRCLLDALRELGDRARGVAVLGGHETAAELAHWHRLGVRGVRVNLVSGGGARDVAAARRAVTRTAERIAPLDWHLQLFAGLPVVSALAADLAVLPVPVVVDHYGLADGPDRPGFRDLLGLLADERAYVKLSAPYRIPAGSAAASAAEFVAANPHRVVWGSDWPHTGGRARNARERDTPEPFREVDDARELAAVRAWAGGHATTVLETNPAELYDFPLVR